MKDSAVGPAGLFDPRRQRRLLEGISARLADCTARQRDLAKQHALASSDEQRQCQEELAQRRLDCARRRRQVLEQWDAAEEDVAREYELETLRLRGELNRLAASYRRELAKQTHSLQIELEQTRQAIRQRHEQKRHGPENEKRKQHQQIAAALSPLQACLQRAREITMARLEHLPRVPPMQNPWDQVGEAKPGSIEEACEVITRLGGRGRETLTELQSGWAARVVDSYAIPIAVTLLMILWAGVAYAVGPQPPWLVMLAGVPLGGLIGFAVYLILQLPLKQLTRSIHPRVEQIAQIGEQAAAIARKISSDQAKSAAAELTSRRDAKLRSAETEARQRSDQLTSRLAAEEQTKRGELVMELKNVERNYSERSSRTQDRMHRQAEQVAQQIQDDLKEAESEIQRRQAARAAKRQQDISRLGERLEQGVAGGSSRIRKTKRMLDEAFPKWADVVVGASPAVASVDMLPVGELAIGDAEHPLLRLPEDEANQNRGATSRVAGFNATRLPDVLPIALHRRVFSGIYIEAAAPMLQQATELVHQLLWRLLTRALPGRAKMTLIDPVGRGQHFTSFMALADHDPSIVDHRVWTTQSKIEDRLSALAHHVEDVLQASLRDRFQRIEDYNEVAGAMAEPYRAVAAVGFPEGLSRESYRHLRALIESGGRCGVFTLLVCDASQSWPSDMPAPLSERMMVLRVNEAGDWSYAAEGLGNYPLRPAPSPPAEQRGQLIEQIGKAAVAASHVEIPLETLISAEASGSDSTTHGIDISIGSQGANRTLSLKLGEGVLQHVLIAGKTGSGKSTLLHAIITSGLHRYAPDELQFYLLDFKKGVEFKPYAETLPPHVRVIGIESEREFGRSVLQRLDAELQERGERFRAAGVQEVAAFRRVSDAAMPRILLVVDEFQELFIRDDRLAADCAMLLDRLVRQGRSFGIHVILSSQSLAGAYSLPRATLGQMAVRIAMQCSESDAALILSDDNTAARLISRPGEAIYNDAGGLVEGNQPFQVAWLAAERHQELLRKIAKRDADFGERLPPALVFEGNRPSAWTPRLAAAALESAGDEVELQGLLGESVEIGPPVALSLSRETGRNALLIAPSSQRAAVIGTAVSGFARCYRHLRLICFDGNRGATDPIAPWLKKAGVNVEAIKPRDAESRMAEVHQLVKNRVDEQTDDEPVLVVIDPLERFRDLRQEESFSFSLDSASSLSGAQALQQVLRDGPPVNVFVLLVCGSAETLARWLPRASQHDLELRILGRLNASDSAILIDSPLAAELSEATMLLYDDADGRITKFRQCTQPNPAEVRRWLVGSRRGDNAPSGT